MSQDTPALRLTTHRPRSTVLHTRVVCGEGGGPDKTILRSARFVDPDHLRMLTAYIHPANDLGIDIIREQAKQHACPMISIPERGPIDPRTVRAMVQLCQKENVTIWHGHDYKTDLLGLIVNRFWPMKLVATAHGFTRDTWRTKMYYHVDNFALRRYQHVIAVSPQLVEHCRRIGVNKHRISYVPNAIDVADYDQPFDRQVQRNNIGAVGREFVIGVVGRLSKEKGVDRAIRTLARLLKKYPQVVMHIVGDGPERNAIEALVAKLNLSKQVTLHGWQSNTRPYYAAMDMLLLPSHTEGLPNVVLEAMTMRVPVAATNVGGVRDLLKWGACGVVLDEDELAWPNHIAPLIASEARRDEFARRSRQRIEKHFTFEKRMAKVVRIYERLLRVSPTVARAAKKTITRRAA